MPEYKMTEEYQKILTEMIGEEYHELEQVRPNDVVVCTCGDTFENKESLEFHCKEFNRTFLTDPDMMKVFRWLVDNGKWEKFNLWTYSLNRPSISNTAWLFYDAERFCCLAAMAKIEGVLK
jgi:hypothetical protein